MDEPTSGPCIRCRKPTTRTGVIPQTRWCIGAKFWECTACAKEIAEEQAADRRQRRTR